MNGPVWRGPWDATPSIVLSYLPIPFLVAAMLWRHRQLKVVPFLLHTVELVFAKFMVTALFLVGLWMWRGSPPPPEPVPLPKQESTRSPRVASTPTVFAPSELRELNGQVLDAKGNPVPDAWVAVTGGLEGLVFPSATEPVRLVLDAQGFAPSQAAVQVGQPLVIESRGPALHTAQAISASGLALFNLPVLSKQEARHVFEEPATSITLRCTVHGKSEQEAALEVLTHPFFTRTDAQGKFRFSGVPRRRLHLSAKKQGLSTSLNLDVDAEATLTLPSAPDDQDAARTK